jgi:hypothetical protein
VWCFFFLLLFFSNKGEFIEFRSAYERQEIIRFLEENSRYCNALQNNLAQSLQHGDLVRIFSVTWNMQGKKRKKENFFFVFFITLQITLSIVYSQV